MSRKEINKYQCKLRLIQHGLLSEAQEIDNIEVIPEKDTAEADDVSEPEEDSPEDGLITRRNNFVKKSIKNAKHHAWDFKREKNEAVAEARRNVVKDFMKGITAGKTCGKCGGVSPTYRKDKYVKIFEKPLSPKDRAKMAQGGFKAENSVVRLQLGKKDDFDFDEGIADMSSNDGSSEGEGESLDIVGDVLMNGFTRKPRSGSKADLPAQRFMNATEVKATLKLLFEKEQEILSLVYNSRATTKKSLLKCPRTCFSCRHC